MIEQRPNRPSPIPEPQHASPEGGNGSLGLPPPPTIHEPAMLPPEKSALNRAVERTRDLYQRNRWTFLPLPEAPMVSLDLPVNHQEQSTPPQPLFKESQKAGMMSGEEIATPQREEETMLRVTSPMPKDRQAPENTTIHDALERQEIEESIRNLKQLRTVRQRISAAQDLTQEQLDKMRQHNKDFIEPVITGLNKRPYRIMKAGRLLHRMTKGDISGRKIDYGKLGRAAFNNFPEWECPVPEQYHEQMSEAIWDLADVLEETEQNRNDSKAEITGVINAICCSHDLLSIFKGAEVPPPKIYTRIHRRLEKRRAYLDPDYDKGAHR